MKLHNSSLPESPTGTQIWQKLKRQTHFFSCLPPVTPSSANPFYVNIQTRYDQIMLSPLTHTSEQTHLPFWLLSLVGFTHTLLLAPHTPYLCHHWTRPTDDKRSRVSPGICPFLSPQLFLCVSVCVVKLVARVGNIYAGLILFLLKALDFTLIRELMTIAPAFTIGLCGLSAGERPTLVRDAPGTSPVALPVNEDFSKVSGTLWTHLPHWGTVCWTWIRWVLCPQTGACAWCPGRAGPRRTPGASHTTAGRRELWCHLQSVCTRMHQGG